MASLPHRYRGLGHRSAAPDRVDCYVLEAGSLERSAVPNDGILKPLAFPHVHIDIAQIWPD